MQGAVLYTIEHLPFSSPLFPKEHRPSWGNLELCLALGKLRAQALGQEKLQTPQVWMPASCLPLLLRLCALLHLQPTWVPKAHIGTCIHSFERY